MLNPRQLIPPLTVRTPAGRTVRAWDYKQKKNLVIAFLHANCRRCAEFLERFARTAAALAEQEAVALVVFPEPPLPDGPGRDSGGIIFASDTSGNSQRAYLGEDAFGSAGQRLLGIFVADRYGELYAQWIVRDEDALPAPAAILGRLGQIEVACEECGVSHWTVEP